MNIKRLWQLARTNLVKTIYFNFKMLPFKKALKFPFLFYGRTSFRNLSGKVIINCTIHFGIVKVGDKRHYVDNSVPQNIWGIFSGGNLVVNGNVSFGRGSYVHIAGSGTLSLSGTENNLWIGSHAKIMCFNNVTIQDHCRIAWDCQIHDSSFHYIENLETGEVKPLAGEVVIGNHTWIGNRTTISKGAIIPPHSIIASNSLVTKDLSSSGPYCLFAGIPAEVKRKNIQRIYDYDLEVKYDQRDSYVRNHL